jgi:hypothetical protein
MWYSRFKEIIPSSHPTMGTEKGRQTSYTVPFTVSLSRRKRLNERMRMLKKGEKSNYREKQSITKTEMMLHS